MLWADGCTGPMVQEAFLDFSKAEAGFPFSASWQPYTQGWAARAARGPGVAGGPRNDRTSYFYNFSFHPFGATWGGKFKPTQTCSPVAQCGPGGGNGGGGGPPSGSDPAPTPCPTPGPTGTPGPTQSHGKPTPTPTKTPSPTHTSSPERDHRHALATLALPAGPARLDQGLAGPRGPPR